ncbi:hypothetical protein [Companilactobacillus mishanensis]|uniref:hypothetical protein n=1 Tax=Companilactobacillus mishanensis TaxID=2486008 RepID=UPI001295B8BA|nr:hypothetical protein [Companilactobacillus mishanensis]
MVLYFDLHGSNNLRNVCIIALTYFLPVLPGLIVIDIVLLSLGVWNWIEPE